MKVTVKMIFNTEIILKIAFMIHFFFSVFAVIDNIFGNGYWQTQLLIAFLYVTVFLTKQDSKFIALLLAVTVLSLITDSVFIGVFWDVYRQSREGRNDSTKNRMDFNAAMAIILLALKIPMAILHVFIIIKRQRSASNDDSSSEFDNPAASKSSSAPKPDVVSDTTSDNLPKPAVKQQRQQPTSSTPKAAETTKKVDQPDEITTPPADVATAQNPQTVIEEEATKPVEISEAIEKATVS